MRHTAAGISVGRPLRTSAAERDAARQDYLELTAPGTAAGDVTEQADAAVHELDRRVFALAQECDGS